MKPRRIPIRGFTLIELLATMLIGLVLVAGIALLLQAIRKVRLTAAAAAVLDEQAAELVAQLREDLTGAGAGTGNGNQARFLAVVEGKRVPAAYLSADGKTLTVLKTTPEQLGKVLAVNGTKITINGAVRYWDTLKVGQPVFFAATTGDAALVQLAAVPVAASNADFPGGRVNPREAVVLRVQPLASCTGRTPLTSVIQPDAVATPLGSVVRYYAGRDGVVREELPNCAAQPAVEDAVLLAPLLVGNDLAFTYAGKMGESTTLPADLKQLTGIGVKIGLKEPASRLEKRVVFEATVGDWRRP
jgi:prepilin-type N-terminal cleavage/methylation domain-containing protein